MPSQIFVISFEIPETSLAIGVCAIGLRGFGPRAAGLPFELLRVAGRVDDGRDFVTDGEAMPPRIWDLACFLREDIFGRVAA